MSATLITPRRRRGAVVATLAVASLGLLAGFAPAASAHPGGGRPQLTDEQQSCLEAEGIVKPEPNADGERVRPTDEQKAAFKAAAEKCGIELPAGGPRGNRPKLTDEQQSCLEAEGIVKPKPNADGERVEPTDEQKAAFKAAAEKCGIELPVRGPKLTDEQKTCLEEQGIEKPAKDENGRRVKPTDEQKAAFEAAAAECGIELPKRPSDAPSGDTQAENTDAS